MAGRPRGDESKRRTHELLAHVAAGATVRDAVKLAKVKPDRLCGLLDEPEFRRALCGLLEKAA